MSGWYWQRWKGEGREVTKYPNEDYENDTDDGNEWKLWLLWMAVMIIMKNITIKVRK